MNRQYFVFSRNGNILKIEAIAECCTNDDFPQTCDTLEKLLMASNELSETLNCNVTLLLAGFDHEKPYLMESLPQDVLVIGADVQKVCGFRFGKVCILNGAKIPTKKDVQNYFDGVDYSEIGKSIFSRSGATRKHIESYYGSMVNPITGKGKNLLHYKYIDNRTDAPKDEFMCLMQRATNLGGYIYASPAYSGRVIDDKVYTIDGKSWHSAALVAHRVPYRWHVVSAEMMQEAFLSVSKVPLRSVLRNWVQPFTTAFHGLFRFTNLRLREGSVFERDYIGLLPRERFKVSEFEKVRDFQTLLESKGYGNAVSKDAIFLWNRLAYADVCEVGLNEITAWCMAQVYSWDSVECLGCGLMATNWKRPPEMCALPTLELFYTKEKLAEEMRKSGKDARRVLGHEREQWKQMLEVVTGNEQRNEYGGNLAIVDGRIQRVNVGYKKQKVNCVYSLGQRIVSYGMMGQVISMRLLASVCTAFLHGSIDSHTVICPGGYDAIEKALKAFHNAQQRAIRANNDNLVRGFGAIILNCMGCYSLDSVSVRHFTNGSNSYAMQEKTKDGYQITVKSAGLPKGKKYSFEDALADYSAQVGFNVACNVFFGWNKYLSGVLFDGKPRLFNNAADERLSYMRDVEEMFGTYRNGEKLFIGVREGKICIEQIAPDF